MTHEKISTLIRVPTAQGKKGKVAKTNPCREKHREFEIFAKTQGKHREFRLLKLSKDTAYGDICCKIYRFFKVSLAYQIGTNFLNWHKENFESNRKNARETQGI